ncbi:MAG: hypothetical protein AAF225_07610 [Pseudomonadota bacterium]
MKRRVPCEAFEVIEDHHELLKRVGIKIPKQRDHAGAGHEIAAAGGIVREDARNLIPLIIGILTAT